MGRPDLLQPRDAPPGQAEAPADQAGPQVAADQHAAGQHAAGQDSAGQDDPQSGSRIAAARGIVIGLAISAVLWAGILTLLLRG